MDINTLGTYHAAHYLLPLLFPILDGHKAFLGRLCDGSMDHRGADRKYRTQH